MALQLSNMQYFVKNKLEDFNVGDRTFLKSGSPVLIVIGFRKGLVVLSYIAGKYDKRKTMTLPPACIVREDCLAYQYSLS